MNVHHKRAVAVFVAVLAADVALGYLLAGVQHVPAWHGVYCTVGITTTNGCDLAYSSGASYLIATVAMVLLVPFWSGVFSLFTTGFVADHVDDRHDKLMEAVK